jgi:hypothetical protein
MNRYDRSGRRVHNTAEQDILRAITTHGYLAAHYLAAEERRQDCIAHAELRRSLRRGTAQPTRAAGPIAVLRRRVGAALIGAGHRVVGAAGGNPVAEPATEVTP